MMLLKGSSASPGIAIGKALVLKSQELKIEKREVKFTEGEIARLQVAIEKAAKEIENIREKTLKEMGEDEAQIFEAHLMLLQDPEFFDQTKSLIEQSNVNAEYA